MEPGRTRQGGEAACLAKPGSSPPDEAVGGRLEASVEPGGVRRRSLECFSEALGGEGRGRRGAAHPAAPKRAEEKGDWRRRTMISS